MISGRVPTEFADLLMVAFDDLSYALSQEDMHHPQPLTTVLSTYKEAEAVAEISFAAADTSSNMNPATAGQKEPAFSSLEDVQ